MMDKMKNKLAKAGDKLANKVDKLQEKAGDKLAIVAKGAAEAKETLKADKTVAISDYAPKKVMVVCHRLNATFKRPVAHRCNPARSALTTVAKLRSSAAHSWTKLRQARRPFARPRRRHFRRVTVASRVKRTIAASFFVRRVTCAAQAL